MSCFHFDTNPLIAAIGVACWTALVLIVALALSLLVAYPLMLATQP